MKTRPPVVSMEGRLSAGFGWLWLALAGFGWLWLALAGFGWLLGWLRTVGWQRHQHGSPVARPRSSAESLS